MKPAALSATISFLLWGAQCSVFAAPPELAEPSSPAVHRAPQFSSWSISLSYPEKLSSQGEALPPDPDRISSLSVRKANKVYQMIVALASGAKREIWSVDGLQLQKAPGSNVVALLPTPQNSDFAQPSYFDFSSSDFPELSWVSLDNYKGTQIREGKPCYLFESGEGRAKRTVFLSDQQLPIEFITPEVTRVYSIKPASGSLTPPPDFLQAFATYKRGKEALQRQASPP